MANITISDKVESYSNSQHYFTLCSWLTAKEVEPPDPHSLSSIGLIADKCAIGFMYLTNSSVCYLDCFAADPKAPVERRSKALDLLVHDFEVIAKTFGFTQMRLYSSLLPIQNRVLNLGYMSHGPHVVFTKDL